MVAGFAGLSFAITAVKMLFVKRDDLSGRGPSGWKTKSL